VSPRSPAPRLFGENVCFGNWDWRVDDVLLIPRRPMRVSGQLMGDSGSAHDSPRAAGGALLSGARASRVVGPVRAKWVIEGTGQLR
jgi:hypothetical protein